MYTISNKDDNRCETLNLMIIIIIVYSTPASWAHSHSMQLGENGCITIRADIWYVIEKICFAESTRVVDS